jgi:hypothetical protein
MAAKGISFENNAPVGPAGQPSQNVKRSEAIGRRIAKISKDKAKGTK